VQQSRDTFQSWPASLPHRRASAPPQSPAVSGLSSNQRFALSATPTTKTLPSCTTGLYSHISHAHLPCFHIFYLILVSLYARFKRAACHILSACNTREMSTIT